MTRPRDQLELPGVRRRGPAHGPWERRAEFLLRRLRATGVVNADTAGYADALRMAGRDRDLVECDPDARTWDRAETRRGWDAALARLVDPPTAAGRGEDADPFAALDRELDDVARRATLGDPAHPRPAD